MARQLEQLKGVAEFYDCPIVYAGDIFDRWDASAETINFALDHLPPGFSIPGQHDLPYHNYEDIRRSAYWTLCRAGVLTNLIPETARKVSDRLWLWAFPWGFAMTPRRPDSELPAVTDKTVHLAVVHRYVWAGAAKYVGAPDTAKASGLRAVLAGYHAAVFGDNHSPFEIMVGKCNVFNGGGFMRRRSDERQLAPGCGLLLPSGEWIRVLFDCSADKFSEAADAPVEQRRVADVKEFFAALSQLGEGGLDFKAAVARLLQEGKASKAVRKICLEILEEADAQKQ